MKEFIKINKTNGIFEQTLKKILDYMASSIYGETMPVLLSGQEGVGKTSLVKELSQLLGLPLFIIEGSVSNSKNIKYTTVNINDSDLGEDLISQITKAKKLDQEKYINQLKNNKNFHSQIKKSANLIKLIRDHYDSILLVDDCFIMDESILRNIAKNRKIGKNKIPDKVYILFASTIDETVKIPMDLDFFQVNLNKITKDEWFYYFKNKFIDNEEIAKRVNIKPEVFNNFYETLNNEDINYHDKYINIRISPRKWEQLLLYINTSLPVKNKYEAQTLVANVKNFFKNYHTGIVSHLFNKILYTLTQIINQTGNFNFSAYELDVSDKWIDIDGNYHYKLQLFNWKSILKQQLQTKIKLDSNSKTEDELIKLTPIIHSFIPSLTIKQDLEEIAKEFDLELIFESIYDAKSLSNIIQNIKTPTKVKGKGKYKYLIVLDEIYNIENNEFFYQLKYELLNKPEILDDVLIVLTLDSYIGQLPKLAANQTLINIANVIESRPNWEDLEKHILKNTNKEYIEKLGFDLEKAVFEALKLIFLNVKLIDNFYGRAVTDEESLFYLQIGYNKLYIPPKRLYNSTKSLSNAIFNRLTLFGVGKLRQATRPDKNLKNILKNSINDETFEENYKEVFYKGIYDIRYLFGFTEKDKEKFYKAILEEIYQEFKSFLIPNSTIPLRLDTTNSLEIINQIIFSIPEIKAQFKPLFEKTEYESLYKLLKKYEKNIDDLVDSTIIFNYIEHNSSYPTKISSDFVKYVEEKIDYINNTFKNQTTIVNNKEIPLDGYNGVLFYTNILKIIQAILEIFENNILNDEEVYFLLKFSNTTIIIAKLVYEKVNNIKVVISELSNTKEIETQKEIAKYISEFFNELGLNIEIEELLTPYPPPALKIPAPKGYFKKIPMISDSFLYEE